jgi:hypothetical protein
MENRFVQTRSRDRRPDVATNSMVAICQGGPASLSPSPRAWPVVLGAADMPIGCALTFSALRRGTPGKDA